MLTQSSARSCLFARGFVERRNVRLDCAIMDQLVQDLGRAVAGAGDQSPRPQVKAVVSALDVVLAAITSAWRTAVDGFRSIMTAGRTEDLLAGRAPVNRRGRGQYPTPLAMRVRSTEFCLRLRGATGCAWPAARCCVQT
jgi:hypothetical protein